MRVHPSGPLRTFCTPLRRGECPSLPVSGAAKRPTRGLFTCRDLESVCPVHIRAHTPPATRVNLKHKSCPFSVYTFHRSRRKGPSLLFPQHPPQPLLSPGGSGRWEQRAFAPAVCIPSVHLSLPCPPGLSSRCQPFHRTAPPLDGTHHVVRQVPTNAQATLSPSTGAWVPWRSWPWT